jgi:hypothetical protein
VRVVACDGDNLSKVERLLEGWAAQGIYAHEQLQRAREALAERRTFILPADGGAGGGAGAAGGASAQAQLAALLQGQQAGQGQMRRYTLYRPGRPFGPEALEFRLGAMWGSMAKLEPWLVQRLQLPFQLTLDSEGDLGADEELGGWPAQPGACIFKNHFEQVAAADPAAAQRLQVRRARAGARCRCRWLSPVHGPAACTCPQPLGGRCRRGARALPCPRR